MNAPREELHKDHVIRVNQVPDAQFDFDDIGWAFRIFRGTALIFSLDVKTTSGRQANENDRSAVLDWGRQKVKSMIDAESYAMGEEYCWQWARLLGEPPASVPCDGFIRRE